MRACIAALLLLASSLAFGQFGNANQPDNPFGDSQQGQEFLPVEEAYVLATELQEDGTIRLYWQIADAYYLYRHRFAFALEDGQGQVPLAADIPPGLDKVDEFFGEVSVHYHDADITLRPERATETARLTVSSQGCADAGLCYPPRKQYFSVDFSTGTVTETGRPAAPGAGSDQPAGIADNSGSLVYMLLLAFIGGSILNLMPCVFPILSLKVLSFARSSAGDRHLHGWIYTAGVIASFVAVAGILISLQQAGRAVGWGFQLQSPGFVIALAYLFVVMGLALSGVIQLGAGLMNTGNSLAGRGGHSGSFFTGVLAVVVASPCTAPFMGSALGYAVTQPPTTGLLVFAALGAGMAAPMLALSYSSWLRRIMPRPGPWMETLKELLAFPLYATAIWLFWVAGKQTGVNTMAVALLGALMLALGLWLWRGGHVMKAVAALCLVAGLGLGTWRGLDNPPIAAADSQDRVAWSEQRLTELRASGQPVFVDVTADWCITCIANEQAVLYTADMQAAFAERGVVYMVADWTNYDAGIAAFLKRHGRTGIPLYLLYPADPDAPPQVLPQILTRSTVLEALAGIPSRNAALASTFPEDHD